MKKKKLLMFFNILTSIITIFCVVFCVCFVIQKFAFEDNGIFGKNVFNVESNSMQPKLSKGDCFLAKNAKVENLKVGDIAVYKKISGVNKGKYITHRIVKIYIENNQKIVQTKGDNVSSVDNPVIANDIEFVFEKKLETLTALRKFANSSWGLVTLLIVIFFTLILTTATISINNKNK